MNALEVILDGAGRGTIRLDNQELDCVRSATIRLVAGEVTQVVLELEALELDLTIDGVEVSTRLTREEIQRLAPGSIPTCPDCSGSGLELLDGKASGRCRMCKGTGRLHDECPRLGHDKSEDAAERRRG